MRSESAADDVVARQLNLVFRCFNYTEADARKLAETLDFYGYSVAIDDFSLSELAFRETKDDEERLGLDEFLKLEEVGR